MPSDLTQPVPEASGRADVDELPGAYLRMLPLHALTHTHGLAGLRRRFLLEIADFDPDEQALLRRALALSERLHAADARGQEPYMNHVLRVATRIVCHYRVRDVDVLAAALLHDTVEDHPEELAGGAINPTEAALAVIGRDFGERVAALVASVTNPDYDPDRDRDEQYRQHVIDALTDDPWARVIKLSDLTDNAVGMIHAAAAKARRAAAKYGPLVPALRQLINRADTPLDDDVKARILTQLDQTEKRAIAVLDG